MSPVSTFYTKYIFQRSLCVLDPGHTHWYRCLKGSFDINIWHGIISIPNIMLGSTTIIRPTGMTGEMHELGMNDIVFFSIR